MNTPKQPYGYMPPKLGGEGMGKKQDGDMFYLEGSKVWRTSFGSSFIHCDRYYTRTIDVGPDHELVDKTAKESWETSGVFALRDWEATKNGLDWGHVFSGEILAIRRPKKVQQPQPVQIEYGNGTKVCDRCGAIHRLGENTLCDDVKRQALFKLGDAVEKISGDYKFKGIVVGVISKLSGQIRIVVENSDGILHIFSPTQLSRVS